MSELEALNLHIDVINQDLKEIRQLLVVIDRFTTNTAIVLKDHQARIERLERLLAPKKVVLYCEHGKGINDYCEPCGRIHNNP